MGIKKMVLTAVLVPVFLVPCSAAMAYESIGILDPQPTPYPRDDLTIIEPQPAPYAGDSLTILDPQPVPYIRPFGNLPKILEPQPIP